MERAGQRAEKKCDEGIITAEEFQRWLKES